MNVGDGTTPDAVSRFDAARQRVGEALLQIDEPVRSEALAAFTTVRTEIGDSERRIAELETAIHAVVEAAERLSRPGSQAAEMVNAARMTNALVAASKLVGSAGIFPEIAS